MHRDRFPGLADGWARLDGPAGTQMLDSAIEAMSDWMRSGDGANHGGAFQAAHRTDALLERTRASVARLLGGAPGEIVFGPSMTALTMRFSAAIGASIGNDPGARGVAPKLSNWPGSLFAGGSMRSPRLRDRNSRAPYRIAIQQSSIVMSRGVRLWLALGR